MTIKEIMHKEGQSEDAALKEYMMLLGLSKISKYEAEVSSFEKKYGESLESFRLKNNSVGKENFEEDDDLMDWEYADSSLKWWKAQLEEIRRAA